VPVPQQASPPLRNGMNGINQQSFINNAQAIMASFNANSNGHSTPPAGGLHMPAVPNGSSPGPRVQPAIPPSIAAQLHALETTFRTKNPAMTQDQARQLATEHLTRAMMAQRQSAMNAAAGGSGQPGLANSIAATTSPHQYAALLRQQQQQQAQQQAQQQQRQGTPAAGSPAQAQHQLQHHQQQAQQQAQQQQAQQHQHQNQNQQHPPQHQPQLQPQLQPQQNQAQNHQQPKQLQQQQQPPQQLQLQQQQQQRQASGSATPSLPPSTPTPAPAAAAAAPPPQASSATPTAK
jgi:chromatin modification-related protein VID21